MLLFSLGYSVLVIHALDLSVHLEELTRSETLPGFVN